MGVLLQVPCVWCDLFAFANQRARRFTLVTRRRSPSPRRLTPPRCHAELAVKVVLPQSQSLIVVVVPVV